MSAARIIAQSVPGLLCAFPGWKLPVLCRVLADIGATGAIVARAADTTPSVTIERVTTAQYLVKFPAGKRLAAPHVDVYSVAPETEAAATGARVDADSAVTFAGVAGNPLGQFKFHTFNADDGNDDADPPSGDIFDVTFWVDYG